jgi:hypothetical protein
VSLQFRPGDRVSGATMELKAGDAKVDAFVSTPENPASSHPQSNTICLIPKEPLKPDTLHTVKATCTLNGEKFEKEWRFTTGTR